MAGSRALFGNDEDGAMHATDSALLSKSRCPSTTGTMGSSEGVPPLKNKPWNCQSQTDCLEVQSYSPAFPYQSTYLLEGTWTLNLPTRVSNQFLTLGSGSEGPFMSLPSARSWAGDYPWISMFSPVSFSMVAALFSGRGTWGLQEG